VQHQKIGPQIAFANLGGTATLKDCNENNKQLINLQKETYLKCRYGQQGFCGFGISITSKNIFKPKKLNSNAFFP